MLSPNQQAELFLSSDHDLQQSERRTPSPNQDVYRVLCRMLKRIFRFSFNWALQLSWCSTLLSFSGTNVYNWAFLLACFLDLVSFSYFNVKTISGLRSLLLGILGSDFNTLTQHQATCMQTQGKSRILMFSYNISLLVLGQLILGDSSVEITRNDQN